MPKTISKSDLEVVKILIELEQEYLRSIELKVSQQQIVADFLKIIKPRCNQIQILKLGNVNISIVSQLNYFPNLQSLEIACSSLQDQNDKSEFEKVLTSLKYLKNLTLNVAVDLIDTLCLLISDGSLTSLTLTGGCYQSELHIQRLCQASQQKNIYFSLTTLIQSLSLAEIHNIRTNYPKVTVHSIVKFNNDSQSEVSMLFETLGFLKSD